MSMIHTARYNLTKDLQFNIKFMTCIQFIILVPLFSQDILCRLSSASYFIYILLSL